MSVATKRQGGQQQGPQPMKLVGANPVAIKPIEQEDGHSPCTVMIEVPVSDVPLVGYQIDSDSVAHLDVNFNRQSPRSRHYKIAFMRIKSGLIHAGAKCPDGLPVVSNADVLRWLLDQVGSGGLA